MRRPDCQPSFIIRCKVCHNPVRTCRAHRHFCSRRCYFRWQRFSKAALDDDQIRTLIVDRGLLTFS